MTSSHQTRTTDGIEISFSLHSNAGPKALVTLLHGISVDRHEHLGFYDELATRLVDAGYAIVQFDFRGHGRSGGKSTDFTISKQCIDTITVVQKALSHLSDELPLHFVGTSFGATPALFASTHFRNTRSTTLLSPVLDYRKTFLVPETEWAKASFTRTALTSLPEIGYLELDGMKLSWSLVIEMDLCAPTTLLPRLRSSLRIIHGDKDSMVPYRLTHSIARKHRLELKTLKGMDHGFVAVDDDTGHSPASQGFKARVLALIVQNIERRQSPKRGGRE